MTVNAVRARECQPVALRGSLLWISWANPPTIMRAMGKKSAPARGVIALRGAGSSTPMTVSASIAAEMRA